LPLPWLSDSISVHERAVHISLPSSAGQDVNASPVIEGLGWVAMRLTAAVISSGRELKKIRAALLRSDSDSACPAAEAFTQAIATLPEDSVIRESRLQAFRDELERICGHGSDNQLAAAILACRAAAATVTSGAITSDGSLRARILSDLSIVLTARYDRVGALADLNELIDVRAQAAEAAPPSDPMRGELQYLASAGRLRRYGRLGTPADLDGMIELGREAAQSGLRQEDSALLFSNLCFGLRCRYELTSFRPDLSEAVQYGQQAVQNSGSDHPRRASCRLNYSNALLRRFELLHHEDDLQAGLTAARQATEHAAEEGCLTGALLAQAIAWRLRAEQTGSLEDTQEAVTAGEQAARTAVDQGQRAECLSALAVCLLGRFEVASEIDDLNNAVEYGRQAVDAGAGSQARYLSNYGNGLLRRYQRFSELADLSAAIDACQAAAEAAADGAPDRARYFGNLANALAARFQRTKAAADLDQATAAFRAALQAAPDDDANRGSYLNGLAGVLIQRPDPASPRDVAEAADLSSQAVQCAPPGSPQQAMFLAGRSLVMVMSFRQTGNKSDLDQAVEAGQRAVALTDRGHQFRALYLGRLVMALLARSALERDAGHHAASASDQAAAGSAGREASQITTAPPAVRAAGAAAWGHAAAAVRNWAEAVQAYQVAVELATRVAPPALARADQEHELAQLVGLGSRAAACCLELGDHDLAVELLEQGRGVLLGQALDARTDLTALASVRPDLATRFAELRLQLDAAGTPAGNASLLPDGAANQDSAARASRTAELRRQQDGDLEAVITEARQQPGMERFLLPPRVGELSPTAAGEYVVMITVDEIRCDALLLTAAGVRVVSLPGLSPASVQDHTTKFLASLEQTLAAENGDIDAEARLTAVLGWLWDTVTSPVLDALGITESPGTGEPWPRIWWCPSGVLSFLPLHAAGHHGTRLAETVLDRAVSSYTATARALLHARRPPTAAAGSAGQVLVVAMEHTPDAVDLPAAPQEASLLAGRFGDQAKVLDDAHSTSLATSESVLKAMPDYPWAHFACHATVDLRDPSASHLLLHDHDVLTVLDVDHLRLQAADLAFLSACSTAMTSGTLPDEAINLASAFQMAGYRSVIATLWPVDDDMAADLARWFYSDLAPAGTANAAALALHHAIRLGRVDYADEPSMWAAHVHSGI
jgi:CHAT domain